MKIGFLELEFRIICTGEAKDHPGRVFFISDQYGVDQNDRFLSEGTQERRHETSY